MYLCGASFSYTSSAFNSSSSISFNCESFRQFLSAYDNADGTTRPIGVAIKRTQIYNTIHLQMEIEKKQDHRLWIAHPDEERSKWNAFLWTILLRIVDKHLQSDACWKGTRKKMILLEFQRKR